MFRSRDARLSGSFVTKSDSFTRKSSADWSSADTHSYDDFPSGNLLDETVPDRPANSRKRLPSGRGTVIDKERPAAVSPQLSVDIVEETDLLSSTTVLKRENQETPADQPYANYTSRKPSSDRPPGPPVPKKPAFNWRGPTEPSNRTSVSSAFRPDYPLAQGSGYVEREPEPSPPTEEIPKQRVSPAHQVFSNQSPFINPERPVQPTSDPSSFVNSAKPVLQARKPLSLPRNARDEDKQRFVIAIDYGTTYTGIAFCTAQSNIAVLKNIEVLQAWGGTANSHKVPSVISYSESVKEKQWGMSISSDAVTFVCTKLELEPSEKKVDELELTLQVLEGTGKLDFQNVKSAGPLPAYTWKTPTQIVTDYLSKVCKCFLDFIKPRLPPGGLKIPVDIVVTVPVGWSYQATESTFRAIKEAGFNEISFPTLDHMMVVAEPEAASHFTARHLQEKGTEFLRPREHFVLCDAGGGTVDVVAYQVKELEPHLMLARVSKPTSDKCGASWINVGFKTWLRKTIGRENYSLLDPNNAGRKIGSHSTETPEMRKLMATFEAKKKGFSNESPTILLDLPAPLENLSIAGRVNQGQLTIYFEEMKEIFDQCVTKVITLIKGQCHQVERKNRKVRNVFLVGGFGESPYLQEELQKSLKIRAILMRKPDKNESWTAVVQGAVIYGVEKSRQTNVRFMKMSPRSYGIVVNEAFSAYKFNPRDRYVDELTKKTMARQQFAWMVRRGDLILSNERKVAEKEFSYTFRANDSRKFEVPIYTFPYDDDDVPERWETGMHDVIKLGVVPCSLSNFSLNDFESRMNQYTNEGHYIVYLVCKMQLSLTNLEVDVFVNETSVGHVDIVLGNEGPPGSFRDSDDSEEYY